jgi:hypothetical protein
MSGYSGFLYGPSGQQIYPTPRESPGKYKPLPLLNREIKRSISQYDHAELVSLAVSLCCRIPALRAAIRDKNSWAFANWLPIYHGENEAWGEAAEDYLTHEVFPNAMLREIRQDFGWGMRVSGMGLDMYGDDLCIFTEDEQHNPKVDIVPGPRIGNGLPGFQWVSTMYSGAFMQAMRADGMGEVNDGRYKGLPVYNGVIRSNGRPIACRVLGFNADGTTAFSDIDLTTGAAHYACEMEFFGQGRGLPRVAASVLQWMKKEEIDDQFLKGLANAAQRAVVHKLAPGRDAVQSRGNAIHIIDERQPGSPPPENDEERAVFVEYSQDGNVAYIGADEELGGINFENPHPNAEQFAVRVLMECLADLGWPYALLDASAISRAPTRMEASKANNSISDRQTIEEIRTIRFCQYAVAKGMDLGRIPRNDAGIDPYKWGVGFPAQLSIDAGNDATAALNNLRMGLTNERIEAAKSGYIAKHILRQREKEIAAKLQAADRAVKFVKTLGYPNFSFEQALSLFYQPSPNAPTPAQVQDVTSDEPTNKTPKNETRKDSGRAVQ